MVSDTSCQLVSIVSVSSSATAGMSASVAVTRVLVTDCVERSTSDVERSTSVVIICSDYKNIKFILVLGDSRNFTVTIVALRKGILQFYLTLKYHNRHVNMVVYNYIIITKS